jgi:hypothetical protein
MVVGGGIPVADAPLLAAVIGAFGFVISGYGLTTALSRRASQSRDRFGRIAVCSIALILFALCMLSGVSLLRS